MALLTSNTAGFKTALTQAAGSSTVQAYTSLAIEYALNSSGLPVDVISSPEVVGGVVTGNVTGVLSFLAATYSLPAWSVDAVVALSGAARPTPSGLGALLTSQLTQSRLESVLRSSGAREQMRMLGQLSAYDTAVASGEARQIAMVIVSAAASSAGVTVGRRAQACSGFDCVVPLPANVTAALSKAVGMVSVSASVAGQLEDAFKKGDVLLALRAVVAALGQDGEPLGRALEVVVVASSLPLTLDSGLQTVAAVSNVVSSAAVVLHVDPNVMAALNGLSTLGSIAYTLFQAFSASPIDIKGAFDGVVLLAVAFDAPSWVVTGLQKVGGVASLGPPLVKAVSKGQVTTAITHVVEMVAVVSDTGPWMVTALKGMMAGNVTQTVEVLRPHLNTTLLFDALSIDKSSASPLNALMSVDTHVYDALVAALAAGQPLEALTVVMNAVGAPSWARDALVALLTSNTAGFKTALTQAAGSSTVQAYTSLAIEYALNSSGLPVDVISSPEVVGGVVTGNVTGVLSFLAATYSLPAWSVDAVVALSGAARPTPSGLGALLTSQLTQSRLESVLRSSGAREQMRMLGQLSAYDTAVASGEARQIAMVIVSAAASSAGVTVGRRAQACSGFDCVVPLPANVTAALSKAVGMVSVSASVAGQLEDAFKKGDVLLALRAVVAALGQDGEPLGRALEVVVVASSLPLTLDDASSHHISCGTTC